MTLNNFINRVLIKIGAWNVDFSHLKEGKYNSLFQFKHGFFKDTMEIEGINKNNYKKFLSNRRYLRGHPWNGPFSGIIDNKLFLPYLLCSYRQYLPKTFLFKDKSGFLPIFDGLEYKNWERQIRLKPVEILPFLKSYKEVVLKHTYSSVGEGFHFISSSEDRWMLDGKEILEKDLVEFLDSLVNYILQEKIEQAEYSKEINGSSVNTIRLQCAWNNKKKEFEIIRGFHRFGSKGQIVDNLGQGNGVLVYLDPRSGVLLKEGVINDNGIKKFISNEIIFHPESKIQLSGLEIPNYAQLKNKILEISNSISFLRWLGWDIALTEDSFKIIEINSLTTLDTIQQNQGFLETDWLVDIFNKRT